jgi:hypothetical protein
VHLWVGREEEAVERWHTVVRGVIGGRWGHEVAGSETTSFSLLLDLM